MTTSTIQKPMITKFDGPWRFLSNFWEEPLHIQGMTFKTAEHAFQAAKCADTSDMLRIMKCQTPGEAKRMGRQVKLRLDWEEVKIEIMLEIVRAKFQNQKLAQMLLHTESAELIEGNTWGDTFWGVCNGQGKNWLGSILMVVRSELFDETSIFVFGSNHAGRHGKGAAKTALDKKGAIYGQGEGLQGRSYGIPTKDEKLHVLPLSDIEEHVNNFIEFALQNLDPLVRFQVTAIGTGLSRYSHSDIAPLFEEAPDNCYFDNRWKHWLPNKKFWGLD